RECQEQLHQGWGSVSSQFPIHQGTPQKLLPMGPGRFPRPKRSAVTSTAGYRQSMTEGRPKARCAAGFTSATTTTPRSASCISSLTWRGSAGLALPTFHPEKVRRDNADSIRTYPCPQWHPELSEAGQKYGTWHRGHFRVAKNGDGSMNTIKALLDGLG